MDIREIDYLTNAVIEKTGKWVAVAGSALGEILFMLWSAVREAGEGLRAIGPLLVRGVLVVLFAIYLGSFFLELWLRHQGWAWVYAMLVVAFVIWIARAVRNSKAGLPAVAKLPPASLAPYLYINALPIAVAGIAAICGKHFSVALLRYTQRLFGN